MGKIKVESRPFCSKDAKRHEDPGREISRGFFI
jgi:hypothetical protein